MGWDMGGSTVEERAVLTELPINVHITGNRRKRKKGETGSSVPDFNYRYSGAPACKAHKRSTTGVSFW